MTEGDERRQFMVFAILRIGGLVMFFLGIAIAFTDIVRPGGWPMVGGILAILGAFDAVLSPRIVRGLIAKGKL